MQRHKFIILEGEGYTGAGLASLSAYGTGPRGQADGFQMLHQIGEAGPMLTAMTVEEELRMRTSQPGLRIVPVTYLQRLWVTPSALPSPTGPKVAGSNAIEVKVVDAATNAPLSGVVVTAWSTQPLLPNTQVWDRTDARGVAILAVPPGRPLRLISAQAPTGYWSLRVPGPTPGARQTLKLRQINLGDPALLLTRYCQGKPGADQADSGVMVGIVDSGIDAGHPALNVSGGTNHVTDEVRDNPDAANRWGPPSPDDGHGTHVAGIVGMRPQPGAALRGVAPGVTLRSYRVFPAGQPAANYDVCAAINRAARDGCQVINLSLGMDQPDEAIRAAIQDAQQHGSLVIAAAGNDGRQAVSFPASLPFCVAVSAYGDIRAFPSDATEGEHVSPIRANQVPETFVAGFSNMGPQVDHTGPGVGVVSTLPGGGYGAASGTSMAAPAVAGLAASLLGQNPAMLALGGVARCEALTAALRAQAKPKGFGRDFEGNGGH